MTDSRRWLETGNASDEALALLRNAAPPHSLGRAVRARSRRRVVALGALPAAVSGFFWLQAMALGALLGAVTMGAVTWLASPQERAPSAASSAPLRSAPHEGARALTFTPSASVAAPLPALPAVATRLPARPNAPTERGPEGAETVAAEAAGSDLVREARLLERARALLGQDPGRALVALRDHEREFASGALALERELLSVDALVRLGRRAEATERAARLRARAPASLYEERLEQLLERTSGPAGGPR